MDVSKSLDDIIAQHPILLTYTRTGTAERLKKFPVEAYYEAARRRLVAFLVECGVAPHEQIMTTFWGDRIMIDTLASRELQKYGVVAGDELFLTKAIVDALRPGDIFIDGGANAGWFTLLAAALVGVRGAVHAFEPTPRMFGRLRENVRGKSNITIVQKALTESVGRRTFHDFGADHDIANTISDIATIPHGEKISKDGRDIEVEAITIDAYCTSLNIVPAFIKLDIEGGEYNALRGAEHTLRTHHPVVAAEVWGGRGLFSRLAGLLGPFSYHPYEPTATGLVPISFDIAAFDAPTTDGSFGQKNIIFLYRP